MIVVISGANRGFGLALATVCAEQGREVVATCRQSSAGLDRLGVRVVDGVDLTTEDGEKRLAAAIARDAVGLAVANAGIFTSMALDDLDIDAVRDHLDVNALGALRMVRAVLPRLGTGSKIALISTRAGSIADNGSGGEYAYRISKAALNMAGVSLAHDLRPRGIAVGVYHPGRLATAMAQETSEERKSAMPIPADATDPLVAARELLLRIDELSVDTAGRFLTRDGAEIPW